MQAVYKVQFLLDEFTCVTLARSSQTSLLVNRIRTSPKTHTVHNIYRHAGREEVLVLVMAGPRQMHIGHIIKERPHINNSGVYINKSLCQT